MQTCIIETASGEQIRTVVPESEQRLHSRIIKVRGDQVSKLEEIMRKLCPPDFEIFVGNDRVVLVSSFSNIIDIESFMDTGIAEEMQKLKEGDVSALTMEELEFLSDI
jgi:hypothetical protein